MLARLALTGCLAATAGCAGFVHPSELRPPAHPLLAATMPSWPTSSPATATRAAPSRRRVVARAAALIGQPLSNDRALLTKVFGEHPLGDARDGAAVWGLTDAREGVAQGGDLLVLVDDGRGPAVAVVLGRRADGALEAVAVTRGAARRVFVDARHPNRRRRGGQVINTFLRPRRQGDPPNTRYLAGARLIGARRY